MADPTPTPTPAPADIGTDAPNGPTVRTQAVHLFTTAAVVYFCGWPYKGEDQVDLKSLAWVICRVVEGI